MIQYLAGYSQDLQEQILAMIDQGTLGPSLLKKYPVVHTIRTDGQLYEYAQELKKSTMRKSVPLQKVYFDPKLSITHNALGLNRHRTMVQGGKLKVRKEIRIAAVFKDMPEPFLRMIVAHELAHLREMDHSRAFYKLCEHIAPGYHQIEFDVRCLMMLMERNISVY